MSAQEQVTLNQLPLISDEEIEFTEDSEPEVPAQAESPAEESKPEPDQPALFEKGEWWQEHWKGMPEYKSEDLSPFKTIFVHFENRQDMEAFAKFTGQKINMTTKSIWYPEAEIDEVEKLKWMANPDKAKVEKLNGKKAELEEILDGE